MALYSKQILIPAGTTLANPIVTTITLRENTLTQISVLMDTVATKGTVWVKISVGLSGFKVWNLPADNEDWIVKAEQYFENIVLPQVVLPLQIICASPNAQKNHTVMVSIHTKTSPKI